MPATESYSGIELPTVSIIYCYVINYYKLNGLESFIITTLGPVDRLGSAGQFSRCLVVWLLSVVAGLELPEGSPGLAMVDGFFTHIWASAGTVVIAEATGHLSFFLHVVTSYG